MVGYNVVLKQGDVYWVEILPHEARGSEQMKSRPFVIVSKDSMNTGNVVVAVPLSSQLQKACAHNIKIPATEIIKDQSYPGTVETCVALTMQVRAIDRTRIMEKLGRLTDAGIIAVGVGLQFIFDLWDSD